MSKDPMDTLFPEEEVELGGEKFNISPFTFGQIPKVVKRLKNVAGVLDQEDFGSITSMMELLIQGGDDIIELVALVLKKDKEWVEELNQEDAIKAISIIITSNHDFFVKRILPIVTATMDRLEMRMDLGQKIGLSQSKK